MLSTHQASSRHHIPSGDLDRRDIKQPEGIKGGHWDSRPASLALQAGGCRVRDGSAWSRGGFGAPNSTPSPMGQGLRVKDGLFTMVHGRRARDSNSS